jgi:hypothetical protein
MDLFSQETKQPVALNYPFVTCTGCGEKIDVSVKGYYICSCQSVRIVKSNISTELELPRATDIKYKRNFFIFSNETEKAKKTLF